MFKTVRSSALTSWREFDDRTAREDAISADLSVPADDEGSSF